MKQVAILLILITLAVSCGKVETPVSDNSTRISGRIAIPKSDEIIISKDNPYDFGFDYQIIATAKLDSTGAFSVEFPLEQADIVQLKNGDETLIKKVYVYTGDELIIDYDNLQKDIKIKFEGESANANEYISQIAIQFPKDNEYYQQLINPNLEEFIKWAGDRRQQMLNYYNNYFIKDSIPPRVKNNEMSNINYEWAYLRNEWAIRNYYYLPEKWDNFTLPDNYYSFLKDLTIDEPYLHNFLGRYLEGLVWEWHIKQVKKGLTPTTQTRGLAKFEAAKAKFAGSSRDIAMALCINDILTYGFDERMVEVTNKLMEDFKRNVNDKIYFLPIETKYRKRLSLLKENPAPDFSLPNIYNAPISLSDFIGKTIYVYFWGTVYNPSVRMLDQYKELLEKFSDNSEIAFISIAMEENNFDNWKKMVNEKQLPGIQLYMEGQFSNKVAKDYMINTIPFSMIIDKEGKIIDLNAPFPGLKKLEVLLKALL
ncbi:TlpA family protein disulfide reductase [Bacteroidota bacterium]